MDSESYREQFLEGVAACIRQQEQSKKTPPVNNKQLFSSDDVVFLHRIGINLRPDRR
jgi:hypothetical protein